MKFLFRLLFLVSALLALGLVGALFAMVQSEPLVNRAAALTPERIGHGKRILDANDPRKLKSGEVRNVSLSQDDLDAALNYLAHQYGHGSAKLVLRPSAAQIEATAKLPENPVGAYLNIAADVTAAGGWPRFAQLRIGRLPVPAPVADWLSNYAAEAFGAGEVRQSLAEAVKRVDITDGRLNLTYQWHKDLPAKLGGMLVSADEQERLRVYQTRLAETVGKLPAKGAVSLAELMQPLFKLAAERSASGDAVAENRAVLFVLAFYVNGKDLGKLVPQAKDWPQPASRKTKLNGRDDFPKHFIVSAALAADAGGRLSDAVGLFKEVDDSRGGSGFSFNDIAADRAGVRFGEQATASASSASKLQRLLGGAARESDFMPAVQDLPEFMPEAEFKSRFGGIGEPAYNKMMQDIERRVAALPVNR